jgi:predicted nucleotidyltransferase
MNRHQQLLSELQRLLEVVTADVSVKKVILFGSSVDASNVTNWSDVDICIVQETEERFLDRIADWTDKIQPTVGMDLVVYTPAEFEQLKVSNTFVGQEIIKRGRELYAA